MTLKNFFKAGGHIDICLKRIVNTYLSCPIFHHADSIESTHKMISELYAIKISAERATKREMPTEQLFERINFRCNGIGYVLSSNWNDFVFYINNLESCQSEYYLIATEKLYGKW